VVFDREVAFVQTQSVASTTPNITVVYDPSVAGFLGNIHDTTWQSAFGLEPSALGYAQARDDLKSTILELLASGMKDEVIARRMGMSERSFRRHVAAIMQELAAESRFQAGVRAASTGLLGTAQISVDALLGEGSR
jgi:DNA-binding CsgD family transcriptional regulator